MQFKDEQQKAKYKKYVSLPLGKEIEELLKPVYDDYDFIVGALVFVESEPQRQKFIDTIKEKNLRKVSTIRLFTRIIQKFFRQMQRELPQLQLKV